MLSNVSVLFYPGRYTIMFKLYKSIRIYEHFICDLKKKTNKKIQVL